jgi:hypothetical protein
MSFGPQNNSGYGGLYFAQGSGGGSIPNNLTVSTITAYSVTATEYLFAGNAMPLPFSYAGTAPSPTSSGGNPGTTTVILPFAYLNANFSVLADYQDVAAATNPSPADVFGIWAYPAGVSSFNIVCNNPTSSYIVGWITSGTLPAPPP